MSKHFSKLVGGLTDMTGKVGKFVTDIGKKSATVNADFTIHIITGSKLGAGVYTDVKCILINSKGTQSRELTMNVKCSNELRSGNKASFHYNNISEFGPIVELKVWRESSATDLVSNLYIQCIVVEWPRAPEGERSEFIFPINRWICADQHIYVSEYDFCLPQFDARPDERAQELEKRRGVYEFTRFQHKDFKCDAISPMLKELPVVELPPPDYDWDILKKTFSSGLENAVTGLSRKMMDLFTGKMKKLDELDGLFKLTYSVPKCKDYWMTEEHFGRQRLQHSSPNLIKLCTNIPDNFAVTAEMVSPFLEGRDLSEAIGEKRIFLTDLTYLEDIEGLDGKRSCAPFALFYVRDDKQLVPIAIQLMPTPADDNPVFLPSDEKHTWILAKMYYNEAEAQIHQTLLHLAFTHLIMGTATIAVHRQLSPSHPIYRLLGPHMYYVLPVNAAAARFLLSKGGGIDKTLQLGLDGSVRLLQKISPLWRMDVDGIFPASLKERGVDDPDVLPNYRYRDDGILMYDAIKKYVANILEAVYDEPSKVENDFEVQAWAKELATSSTEGGCGFQGVPGGGHISSREELIQIVTCIIFTCTVQHAAVNFGQYDDYGFLPSFPSWLHRKGRPRNKEPKTEQDVIDALPDKDTWLEVILLSQILTTRTERRLGDFEEKFMYDPIGESAHSQFLEDLEKIEEQIKTRNESSDFPYTYLMPSQMPNAISI